MRACVRPHHPTPNEAAAAAAAEAPSGSPFLFLLWVEQHRSRTVQEKEIIEEHEKAKKEEEDKISLASSFSGIVVCYFSLPCVRVCSDSGGHIMTPSHSVSHAMGERENGI